MSTNGWTKRHNHNTNVTFMTQVLSRPAEVI